MPPQPHPPKPPPSDADTWAEGVMQLHDEAAGVLRLHILLPHKALDLFATALTGNAEAVRLVHALADALRQIETAPSDRPMECACCRRPLHGGAIICVAFADRSDPGCGVTFALCRVCTSNAASVPAKAVEALQTLWPEGRMIEITHPAGGAA
jgi:hypothetical protein